MLNKEEIIHIANLARIGVKEEEIAGYQKDLSAVLDYFKELEELDTNDVQSISHITGMDNVYRNDVVEEYGEIGVKNILDNAPETKDGQIKVKSVL
jgi:aspartyl-tRNA(Asn)/glutamyl-tRNA(Gln) amidotransferase subunit C